MGLLTDVDYVNYYKSLIEEEGAEAEIIFANNPRKILEYADSVICADIHTRARTKRLIKEAGGRTVLGMDDLLNAPVDGSGYNPDYGILGSNKATEGTIKLFPINCQEFVEGIQADIKEKTGKTIEVMVYGDGAFKDPVGKIWELADPVVSPGFTSGLVGLPNELKLKYLADNDFVGYGFDDLKDTYRSKISHLLLCTFTGMRLGSPWNGRQEVNGGYIVVKNNGDVVAFHSTIADEFKDFLVAKMLMESPSHSRHKDMYIYKENDKFYLKLALQLRFSLSR